jgi:ABC-type multidrug transport system ATPase subunit
MVEAEALCSKMGIMIEQGKLECFGSQKRLKNKFGAGFIIQLSIKQLSEDLLWPNVKQFFTPEGVIDLQLSTVFDDQIIQQITDKAE